MHARREEVSGIGRYTVDRQSRPEFLQKMGFKRSRNARGAIPRCNERWHDSLARSLARVCSPEKKASRYGTNGGLLMVPTAGGTLMMVVVAARRVEKRVDVGKRSEVSESANRRRKGWDTGADGRQKQQRETEAGSVIGVFGEACCQRVGDALSLWLRCTKSDTRLSRLGTPSVRHCWSAGCVPVVEVPLVPVQVLLGRCELEERPSARASYRCSLREPKGKKAMPPASTAVHSRLALPCRTLPCSVWPACFGILYHLQTHSLNSLENLTPDDYIIMYDTITADVVMTVGTPTGPSAQPSTAQPSS